MPMRMSQYLSTGARARVNLHRQVKVGREVGQL